MVALKKTKPVFGKHILWSLHSKCCGIKKTPSKFHYCVLQNGSMRVLTSTPFLQVFTFGIINAALVQNLDIFCTAVITENMENGSGIFCQLHGTAFVKALTPQSRAHPLLLVAQRALGTAAVGERLCVLGISHREAEPESWQAQTSPWGCLHPRNATPALLSAGSDRCLQQEPTPFFPSLST